MSAHATRIKFRVKFVDWRLEPNTSQRSFSGALTWRDLADGGGKESVVVVAVARLDKDGGFRQAVGEHLAVDVAELDS